MDVTITQTPTGPVIVSGNTDDIVMKYNKSYVNITTTLYKRQIDSTLTCSLKLCELYTYYLDNVLDFYEDYPPEVGQNITLTTFFNDILLTIIDRQNTSVQSYTLGIIAFWIVIVVIVIGVVIAGIMFIPKCIHSDIDVFI